MMPIADNTESDQWARFREQMPITRKWAYFDNAAVAPISTPAREAIQRWSEQATEAGDTVWSDWCEGVETTRQLAAQLVNARPAEIALVANTTAGINFVAEGLPWERGDNVVLLSNEFPTNCYPWLNLQSRGVETRMIPCDGFRVDLDQIAAACDRRTRIVSLSWVGYATGWRIAVDQAVEMAHDRGALFFLDAIQGLGVFPLDVRTARVDFLAADGHKWLLAPEGAGIFYLRLEHLELLRPTNVGWNSVVGRHDYTRIQYKVRPEAARYEGGSSNMAGLLGLGASLEFLLGHGASHSSSRIGDRVLQVSDYACSRLHEIGAKVMSNRQENHRSGIVSFEMPGRSPDTLRRACLSAGVVLSHRAGCLRMSTHAYNNEEDVEKLIRVLSEYR